MRVTARGLELRIGQARLLDRASIEIEPGELLGLIGPNGAGKSTLLRVLAGVRRADRGEIDYGGSPAGRIGPRALSRRVAYLPQAADSAWALSVEALVALGRLPHRRPLLSLGAADPDGAQAIEAALAAVDLSALRHRAVTTLSGGEFARCSIARALALGGKVLLADEPVAALDPKHQLDVMEILRARARAGMAVVIVMHDLALASRYCDRLALMQGGKVVARGLPGQVLTDATLAEVYGVTAQRLQPEPGGPVAVLPWQRLRRPGPDATDGR